MLDHELAPKMIDVIENLAVDIIDLMWWWRCPIVLNIDWM